MRDFLLGFIAALLLFPSSAFAARQAASSFNGGSITSSLNITAGGTLLPAIGITSTGNPVSGAIGKVINIQHIYSPAANEVHFDIYANTISTGTADNSGNAAHFGAGVFRSSDTSDGKTDMIPLEGRADARGLTSGVEYQAVYAYMDAKATGAANASYYALRVKPCVTTSGDCTGANSTGTLRGIYIEQPIGGATNLTHSLYVEGGASYFGGNVGIGTTIPGVKLDVVSSGAVGIRAISGNSGTFGGLQVGRTSGEGTIVTQGSANQFAATTGGSSAGDMVIRTESAAAKIYMGTTGGVTPVEISSTGLKISSGTLQSYTLVGSSATGSGSASLGSNCPATTTSAPATWIKILIGNTTGYIAVFQ